MSFCPACRTEYPPEVETCRDCEFPVVDSLEEEPEGRDDYAPTLPLNLVTVASFTNPAEASVLSSRLEANGIENFVSDAEIIGAHALLSGVVGGVKVQVREEDAARALPFANQAYAVRKKAVPPCPKCRSQSVEKEGLPMILAFLVVLSLGVMALFLRTRWECLDCGHRWD